MNDIVNDKKGHNIVNDIMNDKKGYNIVSDKIPALLISQTACLLLNKFCTKYFYNECIIT